MSRGMDNGYMRVVEVFDKDPTAHQFLRDDGEGGFASGIYRMAREIDRLRGKCGEPSERHADWQDVEDEEIWREAEADALARRDAEPAGPPPTEKGKIVSDNQDEVARTPEEWLAEPEFEGVTVLDPDGWDRRGAHFEASWGEPITLEEMHRRVGASTCAITRSAMLRLSGADPA